MPTSTELVALPEDEARQAINRWSQGFFRIRYLGDKIFLDKIVPSFSYNVRLQTQYEERDVARVSVPYHGQPVNDQGTPPNPWDIVVSRPDDFEERTETVPVPHTDRVSLCPKCGGVGRVDCSQCHGTGQAICSWCGGRGYNERLETRHEHDANGQPAVRTETVRSNCPHCINGRVSCSSCSGNGRITCPACEGTRQVRTFDQLTVRFQNMSRYQVLDTTDVPDAVFEKLKGESIFASRSPRIDGLSDMPHAVVESGRKLLRESQAVDERQSRVLFQDLAVERVPVHEVHYTYAGIERRLWIYGDGHIHAPGAPWRRGRLFTILATIFAGIILLALLFVVLCG